jgi:O-methyltransferase involved in polyketide biosynthesis
MGSLPKEAVYVEANVTERGLIERLKRSGFVPNEKSAFIIEGLIYYLKPKGVDSLFEELAQIPLIGNLFLIDQISEGMRQNSPDLDKRKTPLYPADLAIYLTERGFSIREYFSLGDPTERYYGKSYPERWWIIAAVK